MNALNVSAGLFCDEIGYYPITNWFDADGDECSREDAVVCVAGRDNRWFSLVIADFSETGARA